MQKHLRLFAADAKRKLDTLLNNAKYHSAMIARNLDTVFVIVEHVVIKDNIKNQTATKEHVLGLETDKNKKYFKEISANDKS